MAPGQTTSTGTVGITANNDNEDAPHKTVRVSATASNSQGVTDPSSVTLTIRDDDAAPTVTLRLSRTSISEGGTSSVTASLNRASSAQTTVTVSATAVSPSTSADFSLSANTTLTIAPGQTSSTEIVSITANNDNDDTPDKTVQVSATASNSRGVTDPSSVTLTIRDDDSHDAANKSLRFDLAVDDGINFIHIPLKVKSVDGQPASIETLGDLYEVLKEVNYLLVFDSDTQSWVSYFGDRAADRVLRGYEGVIAFMNNARVLQFAGEVLDTSVNIHSGTNFVGIPRRPSRSYSISDLFLSVPTIYAIIVEDNGQLKTITRADDDGDGPIIGGQSFILITTGTADVTFYGEDWGVPDGDSHDDDDDGAHKD